MAHRSGCTCKQCEETMDIKLVRQNARNDEQVESLLNERDEVRRLREDGAIDLSPDDLVDMYYE